MNQEQKLRYGKIFDLLVEDTISAGGDGHGQLLVREVYFNYKQVADYFSEWLAANKPWSIDSWKRTDYDDRKSVLFGDNSNEGITISEYGDFDCQGDEVTIIIWGF